MAQNRSGVAAQAAGASGARSIETVGAQEIFFQKFRNRLVWSGDLAAVALAMGWAKQITLMGLGNLLYIDGKFDFRPDYSVYGYWQSRRRRKFVARLSLVSEGYWSAGNTYVKVWPGIEVAVDGEVLASRPNICAETVNIDGGGGKQVVVHIVGTVVMTAHADFRYTAFRCSEWLLPWLDSPMFDRFAFDKRNVYNSISGLPVEFRELFVKRGRVVKVLVNPSCEEYASTVRKLYGVVVRCDR